MDKSFAAADVYYPTSGGATAALVVATDDTFSTVIAEHTAFLADIAPYEPGAFYRRELPAIKTVLAKTKQTDLLIIDGYVHLDPHGRPGLGAHAHIEFGIPIIGVAKTAFQGASHAIPIRRGNSTKPLYITAIGISTIEAAEMIKRMAGAYRIPDALRRVDALSRMQG